MKILLADKIPVAGRDALAARGHQVVFSPDLTADDLPRALADSQAKVLVVRSTEVRAECFSAAPSLALVIRAGAGVNTIDLDAASKAGVFVSNCPGKNAIAVAELTMGLMLALDRRIPDAVAEFRGGTWNKKEYGKANGLMGRTLSLVGFGAIAREVATRAVAFGMRVRAWHPWITPAECAPFDVEAVTNLQDLLPGTDVLSVHVPYDKNHSHHLIGSEQLAALPDGAIVLHTSRGGVVDDKALTEQVRAGRLRAGLDVLEGEPSQAKCSVEHELQSLPGAYVMPHIGASTEQAEVAIAVEVARIVEGFATQGVVYNAVNIEPSRPGRFTLIVRHHDKVGVLAHVLLALRTEQLSVKEMSNTIFAGQSAANASIVVEKRPSDGLIAELLAHEHILAVDVTAAT